MSGAEQAQKIAEALMDDKISDRLFFDDGITFSCRDEALSALTAIIAPHVIDSEKLANGILDNEVLINIIHNYAHNPKFYEPRLKSYLTAAIDEFQGRGE